MDTWFKKINAAFKLSPDDVSALRDFGFTVIPGPITPTRWTQFVAAFDSAVACATADDISVGSTTTRVNDFVNRGPEFDSLYIYGPVLKACCDVIGRPFKLSTLHARTVHPNSPAQKLHRDFERDCDRDGWPMVGFIMMIDDFRPDNGATRFVPGSHKWFTGTPSFLEDTSDRWVEQLHACGPAGSIVIYNGSVWHGHVSNRTSEPRRSLQGAFIKRDANAAVDQTARMQPETFNRISELAKYLLAI